MNSLTQDINNLKKKRLVHLHVLGSLMINLANHVNNTAKK